MLMSPQPHEALYAMVDMMAPSDGVPAVPVQTSMAAPAEPAAVPQGWTGDYFIDCVPEGYNLVSAAERSAVWRNGEGLLFAFRQLEEDWSLQAECEGAQEVQPGRFRGQQCVNIFFFDEDSFQDMQRFIFPVDGRWFAIESSLTFDGFANYVQKIE